MTRFVWPLLALLTACTGPLARTAARSGTLPALGAENAARLGPPNATGFGSRHIAEPTASVTASEPLSGARTAER